MVFRMKNLFNVIAILLGFGIVLSSCTKDETPSVLTDFSSLTLTSEGFWNGSDLSGSFTVNGVKFPNVYTPAWSAWNGFAYANKHDIYTSGFGNQYSCYAKKDSSSTNTFVLAYPGYKNDSLVFDELVYDVQLKVTNSTYSALSMKYGDLYSKKFGGKDSLFPDWHKLSIIGINQAGLPTDTAQVYLADYRFSGWKQDYIVDEWIKVNLTKLSEVKALRFELSSSDNGDWGMNTPGYFCLDDLEYKLVSKKE